jgi:methylated-DNA-[protein]-cysteine S-methyltransferase
MSRLSTSTQSPQGQTDPKLSAILAGELRADMRFQEQVWAVCARVPPGKVTTYSAIARILGKPSAGRAVGQALGRNPYAPDVPCHRVVGSGGRLTGYAGGLATKRRMLEQEGIVLTGQHVTDPEVFLKADQLKMPSVAQP